MRLGWRWGRGGCSCERTAGGTLWGMLSIWTVFTSASGVIYSSSARCYPGGTGHRVLRSLCIISYNCASIFNHLNIKTLNICACPCMYAVSGILWFGWAGLCLLGPETVTPVLSPGRGRQHIHLTTDPSQSSAC